MCYVWLKKVSDTEYVVARHKSFAIDQRNERMENENRKSAAFIELNLSIPIRHLLIRTP